MWVRYDDQFPHHPKVAEVKMRDRTALALHLLCGTWSASTSTPGRVSEAATVEQAGSKARAKKWARVLVEADLWHAPGHACDRCPDITTGYVIHDWKIYNPHEELAKKRSEAGRKGAAARWGKPSEDGDNSMANAIAGPSGGHGGAIGNGAAKDAPSPSPSPIGGSVDQSSSASRRARETDDDSKIERRITEIIHAVTGRLVDDEWATKVRHQILDGRTIRDPIAYVVKAIRDDPQRYLPTSRDPSSRTVAEALHAARGEA